MAAEGIPGEDDMMVDDDVQDFALEQGDLVIVIHADGEPEVYIRDDESEEGTEASMKAQFMVEFIMFALGNQECLDQFAKTRLN